jgi:hypothetical protein
MLPFLVHKPLIDSPEGQKFGLSPHHGLTWLGRDQRIDFVDA